MFMPKDLGMGPTAIVTFRRRSARLSAGCGSGARLQRLAEEQVTRRPLWRDTCRSHSG